MEQTTPMIIDLRSDTVTRPTLGMLHAMMSASVGDDVLDGDPTVNELEEKCSRLFNMESAVFCPSGTMTNQIAISLLTRPYDHIICYENAHIYRYEGGGLAGNIMVGTSLVQGDRGRLSIADIASNLQDHSDPHLARMSLVALENTVLSHAGSCYTLPQFAELSTFTRSHGLSIHLDGARAFNALIATGDSPGAYGNYFDTISICLSKGLGAPVGSVVLCKKKDEQQARRMRKVFGGAMRQAGYLAAAGVYALDHHIERLQEDHDRAQIIKKLLEKQHWVKTIQPVDTNIIIFEVQEKFSPTQILSKWEQHNIKGLLWSDREIRLVTHLDINDTMMDKMIEVTNKLL